MATKRKCPSDGETSSCGAASAMCITGCGFFGSAATNHMCSRCYQEHLLAGNDGVANHEPVGVFFASAPPEKKAKLSVAVASSSSAAAAAAAGKETAKREQGGFFALARPEKKARMSVADASSSSATAAAEKTTAKRECGGFFAFERPENNTRLSVAVASSTAPAAAAADTSSSSPATGERPAATANRCATCRKKVGLTGFKCRCGGTFCGGHRYADEHSCGFDYKSSGREQIAKQNPVVVADKLTTRI